jgi:hypothetical protein
MAVFDQAANRVHLFADYGVAMMLGRDLDETRRDRTVANWAISCVGMAVEAALCDLDEQCEKLLSRAADWLQIAISDGEIPPNHYGPNIHEARSRHVLAVTKWLRTSTLDQELLSSACSFLATYFAQVKDKVEVAHNLPTFVLANRWQELESHFQNCRGLEAPDLHRPIRCPGKMSFVLAEHELNGIPDTNDLQRCFGKFMAYQMAVCLRLRRNGLGTWVDVPTWTLIDELNFAGEKVNGPANIRRALRYI